MNQITWHPKYGAVYDHPGNSGGGYMVKLEGWGWIKNPNYGKPQGLGGGDSGLTPSLFGSVKEAK